MLYSGWETFSPAPGTVESMRCRVCDELMPVQRNLVGATSFIESMGGSSHAHDRFTCQYADADWHVQVLALRIHAQKTPSAKLQELLLDEAREILKTRVATKQIHKISI